MFEYTTPLPQWAVDSSGLRSVLSDLGDDERAINDKIIEFLYSHGGPDLRYMQSVSKQHDMCYNDDHIKVNELFWLEWYFEARPHLHSIIGGYLSRLSAEHGYLMKVLTDDQSYGGTCNAYHIDIVNEFKSLLDEEPEYMRQYRLVT